MKNFSELLNENANFLDITQPIVEGGHAFTDATGITQDEVVPTIEDIKKRFFFPILGLADDEFCLLGSAGKKANPKDISGDLDIAIYLPKVAALFQTGLNTKEILNSLQNLIKSNFPDIDTRVSIGFGICHMNWPIYGRPNEKVQVDIMLSDSIEWSKFAWHSPNLAKMESEFKGAHRNIILGEMVKSIVYEINSDKYNPEIELKPGQIKNIKRLSFDIANGLAEVVKNYVGKRGNIIKTAKTIEKNIKTKIPSDFVRIVLGEKFDISDCNSFESLFAVLNDPDYICYDKRDIIKANTIDSIIESNLPLPRQLS